MRFSHSHTYYAQASLDRYMHLHVIAGQGIKCNDPLISSQKGNSREGNNFKMFTSSMFIIIPLYLTRTINTKNKKIFIFYIRVLALKNERRDYNENIIHINLLNNLSKTSNLESSISLMKPSFADSDLHLPCLLNNLSDSPEFSQTVASPAALKLCKPNLIYLGQ